MSTLLGMSTSDCENNARFIFHVPINPYEQLVASLILKMHSKIDNFELFPPAKREQLRICNIEFDDVQSNWFTTV